ncbi:unnamed protein product, partial [Rotaria sordida]
MSPYTDMQQQENKPIERKQDKPHDRSSVTSEVSTSRCRRTSSESFAQFTENDDDEPLVGKQTEELSSAAQIVHFMRRAWKLPVPDDNFKEGDRQWKAKFVDRLRADLILPMRAQIEQESRKVTQQGQTDMIPIVQILIEGGVSSILTVCESIEAKTPVIVIDGTGRAADLIAHEYKLLYGEQIRSRKQYEKIANDEKSPLKTYKKKKYFGEKPDKSIITKANREKFIRMITSKEGYFLLNSFKLEANDHELRLDDAILEAQINAAILTDNEQRQNSKKLKLAMAWNKYDKVAQDILTTQSATDWPDLQLDDALREALLKNSVNFVELLAEYGASFERLRRLINISDLYKYLDDDNLSRPLPLDKSANTTTSSNPSTGNKVVPVAFDVADQNQNHHSNSNEISINITQWNYCKTYLNRDLKADLRQKQMEQTDVSGKNSDNPITDNYGIIDHFRKKDSFLHGMAVFNRMDVIRRGGCVTEIKINFIQSSRDKQFPKVFLYIVSPGKDQNEFTIIYRHEISDEIIGAPIISRQLTSSTVPTERQNIASNNDNITSVSSSTRPTDSNAHTSSKVAGKPTKLTTETTDASVNGIIQTLKIQEPTLYVQAGQYLAIGFGRSSTRLCRVKGNDSYYITRSSADTVVQSGKPVNSIVAALLASKIYQTAAEKTNKPEKKKDYLQKEKDFDEHAAGIIEKCFQKDEEFAVSILTENSQRYFNYSPLQLAKESNSRSFLATKCVQKYLDKKWFGTIDNHRHSMFWNVVLIFYVAFLCLFSYVLLVDYFPINNNGGTRNGYFIIIPITEIVLHILMFSILIEECIEFLLYYAEKRLCNIHWIPWKYFTIDKWNILDVIAILFYIAGFIPRWISSESAFTVSKLTFYMFSDTLSKAAHNSHIYWAFHRFLLVNEYRRKSPYPPPINLLHYTYKFLKFLYRLSRNKTSDNIHGSLDGASELDSNLYNIISFNAMDRAKISGTVTKVSINFSTAPTTTNPEIWLFVIAAATVASNPHFFIVISKRQLFEKSKQNTTANQQKSATIKLEKGIQTFDTDIKITEGQYLGIRFSPGAGNPYSTGRNQYYFNAPVEPVLNYSILFTNCPTK